MFWCVAVLAFVMQAGTSTMREGKDAVCTWDVWWGERMRGKCGYAEWNGGNWTVWARGL